MSGGWLTFDCFGTIVDWRHGIRTTCDLLFPERGADLLDAFNRHEPEVQSEQPFRRYREVLREALRRSAQESELELKPDDEDALATTLPYWPVFSDASAALQSCREQGWRLAVLTNCDRDLMALTLRRLPPLFELVVTAEDVQSYKPAPAHFLRFQEVVRPEPGGWTHVAQSMFHDIGAVTALGIPAIWVNRLQEEAPDGLATSTIRGLDELPEVVQ
ncbi:MAG TPA: HAD family hydrolase [Chloroflexota bacterium]|nr:HAD family hydrolase [Chloroflexota bacterium]